MNPLPVRLLPVGGYCFGERHAYRSRSVGLSARLSATRTALAQWVCPSVSPSVHHAYRSRSVGLSARLSVYFICKIIRFTSIKTKIFRYICWLKIQSSRSKNVKNSEIVFAVTPPHILRFTSGQDHTRCSISGAGAGPGRAEGGPGRAGVFTRTCLALDMFLLG